ncbi:hypothetical protein [Frisingicoccus sp.]|uniref:hypothetical protein n=1 Tax=Frisingicoccus sp. TaxID=1918627 RepID=UPI003AB787E3
MNGIGNYSEGLSIYCEDREKMIQECKNPIAEGDFKWIFAVTVKELNSYRIHGF